MLIDCPHCGVRDVHEFRFRRDAGPTRPDGDAADLASFHAYVYLRDNPAGLQREYWFHALGCRAWLVVQRDTTNHRIDGAVAAVAAGPAP